VIVLQTKKTPLLTTSPTKLRRSRAQSWYRRLGDHVQLHGRRIVIGVGAVFLVIVCAGGVFIYNGYKRNQGLRALQEGVQLLRSGTTEEATARLEEAERLLPKGEARSLALLLLGKAFAEQEQFDAEKHAYERLLGQAGPQNYIKQLALMKLGHAAERAGDFSRAQELYGEAAELEGPAQGLALLARARVLEQVDEDTTAQSLYDKFLDDYAGSPLADVVQQKRNE
jgi:tetratricopeptide (TPR) repeat protein